jgi:hypothetical protein
MHITVTNTQEIVEISARRVWARMYRMDLHRAPACVVQDLYDTRLLRLAEVEHVTRVAEQLRPETIEQWIRLLDRHQAWWQEEEQEKEEKQEQEVKVYRWEPSKWTLTDEEEEEEEQQQQQHISVYRADWWR